jgi:hypothetical protein
MKLRAWFGNMPSGAKAIGTGCLRETIMQDGAKEPASGFALVQTLSLHKEPILPEGTPGPATAPDAATNPAPVPPPLSVNAPPPTGKRTTWLICIGCAVGVAAGILLTNAVNNMMAYTFFYPVHSNKPSVEVFNELNQMRIDLNKLNDEKKQLEKDKEKEDALRQALSAVKATVPPPADSAKPDAAPPTAQPGGIPTVQPGGAPPVQPGGVAEIRPPSRPRDGFAEVDEEIERLEKMQKTINNILDLFTPPGQKEKEPKKDRP